MLKLTIALLCVACAAANEISDSVNFDPRFFLFNNTGSDDTAAILAGIGGIVAIVLLGLLIWVAVSAFVFPADDFGTGFTGTGFTGTGGFRAR